MLLATIAILTPAIARMRYILWGGILVTVTLPARFALGQTDAWLAVARWLTE
jgi:hypothetical protein